MKKRYLLIVILLFLFLLIIFMEKQKYFIVIENKKGSPLTILPVSGEFSTVYIHSSEKQPWENIYFANKDETFTLKTIKVRSLGPGVPYNIEEGWGFYIKDGFFVYDNININYDYLDIKLSSISPHYLKINDNLYNLVEICGDNADIRMLIKKGLFVDMRRFCNGRYQNSRNNKKIR